METDESGWWDDGDKRFSKSTTYVVHAKRFAETITAFAPLGMLAFGGPAAHVALLHATFVERKKWISSDAFLELMALGQGLPGPTSTQMVLMVATEHGGPLAGLLCFIMWTLPGLVLLVAAGGGLATVALPACFSGLAPAAISLVFVAAFKIGSKICGSDSLKLAVALSTACTTILVQSSTGYSPATFSWLFPGMLLAAGFFFLVVRGGSGAPKGASVLADDGSAAPPKPFALPVSMLAGVLSLLAWALLLGASSFLRWSGRLESVPAGIKMFEAFFRMGSLIYGGGQVVLPMMLTEVTQAGWVTGEQYYDGLGVVQALPGPLFNFAAFLGSAAWGKGGVSRAVQGALIAWLGIFLPGILLIYGVAPFWVRFRQSPLFRTFLEGVNAASAGLVASACLLLWEGAVSTGTDASVSMITGTMVGLIGVPAPVGIATGAAMGALLGPTWLDVGSEALASCATPPPSPPY